ncbi:thiazolylpeptide-type bacteriocin [Kitasatospora sp. NPDC056783]|uniref:thiazolylpeptide-type bacteriocin n=1 Tax=Kitasatospora sp. NPDC056783 TaxID=3345943 RepID=UPI00368899C2
MWARSPPRSRRVRAPAAGSPRPSDRPGPARAEVAAGRCRPLSVALPENGASWGSCSCQASSSCAQPQVTEFPIG